MEIEFIKQMFKDIIENPEYDELLIRKYFSETYVQNVDNEELDFSQFILHIKKLKEKVSEQTIQILNIANNGNTVFTKHLAQSKLKDHSVVKHKVFAEFTIKDGKIIYCDEATIMIDGEETQRKLGSEI